jgi:hypothetical protein
MDTVEWGAGEPPAPVRGSGGRAALTGPILGVVGFALLIVSALLPWATTIASSSAQNGSGNATADTGVTVTGTQIVGLDGLASIPAFAYDVSVIMVLGMAGALLAAQSGQRRALLGGSVGLVGAQLMLLLVLTRELQHGGFEGAGYGAVPSANVTLDSGLYCAYLGLIVMLAAVLVTGLPPGLLNRLTRDPIGEHVPRPPGRSRRRGRYEEPAAPVDLTVQAIKPIDESNFVRPDDH